MSRIPTTSSAWQRYIYNTQVQGRQVHHLFRAGISVRNMCAAVGIGDGADLIATSRLLIYVEPLEVEVGIGEGRRVVVHVVFFANELKPRTLKWRRLPSQVEGHPDAAYTEESPAQTPPYHFW